MKIASIYPESSIDYPKHYGPVIFTSRCNYRCPACHNPELTNGKGELVSNEKIDEWIKRWKVKSEKGWYQGITISGGEPTLETGLIDFIKRIKRETGLSIKLDTNGSDYRILGQLLQENLIDYVAMDVKGPFNLYRKITGAEFIDFRDDLMKGICTVTKFPDYEFRTTVVPIIRDENPEEISFMTPGEIGETAKMIYDCTPDNSHKYFIQPFVPKKNGLLDSRLERFPETPNEILEEGLKKAKEYLLNAKVR